MTIAAPRPRGLAVAMLAADRSWDAQTYHVDVPRSVLVPRPHDLPPGRAAGLPQPGGGPALRADAAPALAGAAGGAAFRGQLGTTSGDVVTGGEAAGACRPGHRLGNVVLKRMVRRAFGDRISDMLAGCRAFSRRFVKSFPALSGGFETETEFTVHALELRLPVGEILTLDKERPAGSASKPRTFRDGFLIPRTILLLVQRGRPLGFFSAVALALLLAAPLFVTYVETGLVPRFPTAILATGMVLLSFRSLACGLILDTVSRGRLEAKHLASLAQPPPRGAGD